MRISDWSSDVCSSDLALSDKTGRLIGAVTVDDSHEVMLIADDGNLIRFKTTGVRSLGPNTQGVRLMRPPDDSRHVSIGRILTEDDDALAEEEMRRAACRARGGHDE